MAPPTVPQRPPQDNLNTAARVQEMVARSAGQSTVTESTYLQDLKEIFAKQASTDLQTFIKSGKFHSSVTEVAKEELHARDKAYLDELKKILERQTPEHLKAFIGSGQFPPALTDVAKTVMLNRQLKSLYERASMGSEEEKKAAKKEIYELTSSAARENMRHDPSLWNDTYLS